MRLLFLCKRRPMGRDLLTDPYGRFHYLPLGLARRGHDVSVLLLDYKNGAREQTADGGLLRESSPPARYLRDLGEHLRRARPDWIVGCSDTWYGILAARLARRHSLRCCIDAYDNYESYIGWAKPLHWLWRRALGRADLLTAPGPGLVELLAANGGSPRTAVVPMAADPTGFEPRDRAACRRALGLPESLPLVGYCGSMHKSRGVDVLFDAIPLLRERLPEVRIVHSGRTWPDLPLPDSIQSFGYLENDRVPLLVNSVDVLVVLNRRTAFGEHSYPVKLYEAMSCQVPVVATRTRATEWILREHPQSLVRPGSAEALCSAVLRQLESGRHDYGEVPTWDTACDAFERALLAV